MGSVDVFGNHGLCGLPEEGAHEKSPKCLDGNLGDFGEFCKGLDGSATHSPPSGKESLISNSRYISLGLSIFPLLFSDILYLPKPMKTGRLKNRKRIFRRPFYPVPVLRQARPYPLAANGAVCTNRTAASDTIRQSAAYKMRWPNSAGCRN